MDRLSASEASRRVNSYINDIDDMIDSVRNNFSDMDFENAKQKQDMEEKKDKIIQECEAAKTSLNNLVFE